MGESREMAARAETKAGFAHQAATLFAGAGRGMFAGH